MGGGTWGGDPRAVPRHVKPSTAGIVAASKREEMSKGNTTHLDRAPGPRPGHRLPVQRARHAAQPQWMAGITYRFAL
jgi:hypothetical protein